MINYLICLVLCLSVMVVADPMIHLYSPKSDFESNKELILFKGLIEDAIELRINGQPIDLYNNRFYIKAQLQPNQLNTFVIEAINETGDSQEIIREIPYFPDTLFEDSPVYVQITDREFDVNRYQWVLRGTSKQATELHINGVLVPITETGEFEYRFNFNDKNVQDTYVQLTGINQYTHLFSYRIGLSKSLSSDQTVVEDLEEPVSQRLHKSYESVIATHYEKLAWKTQVFTVDQQRLINQLFELQNLDIRASDLRLLTRNKHTVVLLPLLDRVIDIPRLSQELKSLLVDQHDTVLSLTWYNSIAQLLEFVFENPLSTDPSYVLLDDDLMSATYLDETSRMTLFKQSYFFN